MKRQPATAGIGEKHPARFEVAAKPRRFFVGPVEIVMPGHIQKRIAHGLGLLGPNAYFFEFDRQRRVVAYVFEKVMDGRRIRVPVTVVHELGKDEIVAAGSVGFVVDLGRAQKSSELVAAQQVGDVIGCRSVAPGR